MNPTILLVGSGAVGSAVAAWLAPGNRNLYVYDRPDTVTHLRENGITAYLQHQEKDAEQVEVNAIDTLEQCPTPDIIMLCVKNYSLDNLCRTIVNHYGQRALDKTIVVGLQNGIANQRILPKYFNKVVYGIVSFNAWLDGPGHVGYQAKGPFLFGTPDNLEEKSVAAVVSLLSPAVEAIHSTHFQDAALCKMVINLTNSLTTLAGIGYRPVDNMSLFQKILSRLTYEGVNIVKAAGFKQCRVGNAPPWILIQASALLPQLFTRRLFKRNVEKMVRSSMAQDIIQNARGNSELEDINGTLLGLAQKHKVSAPYNQAIYDICREQFAKPEFQPLSLTEIWQKMAL